MTTYYQQFDFNRIPLKNVVIEKGATAPASPVAEQLWVDTSGSPSLLKKYDGSTWVAVGFVPDDSITDAKINTAAGIALSKLATNPLARANHTGTQTASTISDFDTQVRTSTLDQLAAPNADVDMNARKVINLDDATGPYDAVNLQTLQSTVDASRAGFRGTKDPVRVATAAGFDVTNPGATVDGVTLANGDSFLVPDDGIYVFNGAGTAATRRGDADDAQVGDGTTVAVGEGTYAGYIYIQREADLGANAQDWGVFRAGGTVYSASGGVTLTGSNFTLDNVTVARGGTGATDAAGARTNLKAAGAYGETVASGDFAPGTPVTVTHNLGSPYIGLFCTLDSTGERVELDWRVASDNSVEITAWVAVTDDINVAVFSA